MEILKSIVLGIIQGITEWLPISSTGHLILVNQFLKLNCSEQFWKLYEVIIQLGSILAVVVLYFHKLNPFSPKKSTKQKHDTWQMWFKVAVGSIPVAILGAVFNDLIPDAPIVIAAALIIYGILFIVIENMNLKPKVNTIGQMSYARSFGTGLFQTLSLIPGTSRSGSTIMGGIILGCSREIAAEYSFFLAIPAMAGASLFRILKYVKNYSLAFAPGEIAVLLTGTLVSFIVSVFAIKFLMSFIKRHDFKAFGWYRIVLGIIIVLVYIF